MNLITQKLKEKTLISLGRSNDCDIIFKSQSVSQFHATIEWIENNKYILKDNHSENGVFVNGKKIHGPEIITKTDAIYIGRYRFSIEAGPENLSNEIAIRVDGISQVFNKIVKLHDTSLEIPKKSLVAILGPSGCGKSILLKALSGDTPPKKGHIYIFGLELNENYEYLKTQIGYVPQDDIVHGDLTVIESLYYAARLRLAHLNKFQIEKKIDEILAILNISEIKNSTIKKISGGQRKRVCIGVELLTDPQILFLDEPTSPLDPQTVYDFLEALRSLTLNGTTVVMVTHKPEELHYMDKAIFMAEGGHVVYYDNTDSFLDYFQVDDAVKVYPNLVGDGSKKWKEKYRTPICISETHINTKINHLTSKTNYISQYFWLTRRYLNIKLNDRINFIILIGQAPIIAFLLCLIFDSFTSAVPFFISLSAIWFGTNNAAREIVSEEKIFKRERMYNQGIFPYLLSKISILTFISLIQSIIFIFILFTHFQTSQIQIMNKPFDACIWMFYLSFASTILGLVLSASVNNTEKVMTIIPIALLPQIMLSGVIAPIKSIYVELLSYFTFARWGTEGAAYIQGNVSIPKYQPKPGSIFIDSATHQISNPIIEKTKHDTITNALEKISENYDASYSTTFGNLASKINLDFVAILFLVSILFVYLFLSIKQKDSMKIY